MGSDVVTVESDALPVALVLMSQKKWLVVFPWVIHSRKSNQSFSRATAVYNSRFFTSPIRRSISLLGISLGLATDCGTRIRYVPCLNANHLP